MTKCRFMGVTVDLDKSDALHDAVMANNAVAALWAADAAASRRWAAARDAANQVWGKPQADFDAAHDALDTAFADLSAANKAACDATRRVAQRLVARDNLLALHARRAAAGC